MLLNASNVTLRYGADAVLDGLDFRIDAGERVCLIGRNGAGKSTLLQLLSGQLEPDQGEVQRRRDLSVASLAQISAGAAQPTALEAACGGAVDAARKRRAEALLTQLSVPPRAACGSLSGGQMRRVAIARALAVEADLLLLDEPTNHLDIEAITWLERVLAKGRSALVMVSHDRAFLAALATRVVELDRGRLHSFLGNYADFIRRRAAAREAEAQANARFDKRLAGEEAWIRQGIKARRTRNEGRVRALEALRAQRAARRTLQGRAGMRLPELQRSGRLVAELEGVGYAYGDVEIVRDFSLTVMRGDKLGLIGANGSGKTTLLKLLVGDLAPQRGSVRLGTRLDVAYFDQQRAQLDEHARVYDSVGDGGDTVMVAGAARHVLGYLRDFLFTAEQARAPVRTLSGGERSRLLLARLFARPANVLVLDEPTNDLDIETLELLEELLLDYQGTLLVASHDRALLNNVVTSTLVFEGAARIREYVGGYDDWLRQRGETAKTARRTPAPAAAAARPAKTKTEKLGYLEQRELDALPGRIEALEKALSEQQLELADPALYRDGERVAALKAELEQTEAALATAYGRWEALENP